MQTPALTLGQMHQSTAATSVRVWNILAACSWASQLGRDGSDWEGHSWDCTGIQRGLSKRLQPASGRKAQKTLTKGTPEADRPYVRACVCMCVCVCV